MAALKAQDDENNAWLEAAWAKQAEDDKIAAARALLPPSPTPQLPPSLVKTIRPMMPSFFSTSQPVPQQSQSSSKARPLVQQSLYSQLAGPEDPPTTILDSTSKKRSRKTEESDKSLLPNPKKTATSKATPKTTTGTKKDPKPTKTTPQPTKLQEMVQTMEKTPPKIAAKDKSTATALSINPIALTHPKVLLERAVLYEALKLRDQTKTKLEIAKMKLKTLKASIEASKSTDQKADKEEVKMEVKRLQAGTKQLMDESEVYENELEELRERKRRLEGL